MMGTEAFSTIHSLFYSLSKIFRALTDSLGLSVIAHIKIWVSAK